MARLEPFPNRNIFVKNNSRKKTELGRSKEVGPIGQPYATSTFSLCLEIGVKFKIEEGIPFFGIGLTRHFFHNLGKRPTDRDLLKISHKILEIIKIQDFRKIGEILSRPGLQ
ncbi:hypothetical protein M0802_014203 [Mischocyttarus mexicanus]|nr:hypothetical protein M0802_014203 [Mischocyttarus mexicanus]